MQKEVVFAIIFGSALGLLVAYGVWRTNTTLNNRTQTQDSLIRSEDQQDKVNDSEPSLGIVTPTNLATITNSPIVITGIANNLNQILISTDSEDYLIVEPKNEFSQEIELSGGINEIVVNGFAENAIATSEKMQVAYTTQVDSDEPLRTSLGVITDITEDYIQMRDSLGEIMQISLLEDTTYANLVGNAKEIDFADLAIGDFIIAMSKTSQLEVLEALRVIVTTEPQGLEITAIKGTVDDYTRNTITIDNKEYEYDDDTLFMDTNADNADFFLKEGQTVIIVAAPILRSVFLI